MDALLVGSRALRYWFPNSRNPKDDYDLFVTQSGLKKLNKLREHCLNVKYAGDDIINYYLKIGTSISIDNDRYKSVRMFLDLNSGSPNIDLFGLECKVATPETLMSIKRSHLYYRHNWYKHIKDYHYLKGKNVEITSKMQDALFEREKERALREKSQKRVDLSKSNQDFFSKSDKAVRRKFKHDDLHLAIAYYERPLYERLKEDLSRASVKKELFMKLDFIDKCRLVAEEASVIGLERLIIPQWHNVYQLSEFGVSQRKIHAEDYKELAGKAYRYAVMRICTDLTKGWFRDFAIDNYIMIMNIKPNYVEKWLSAFERGDLKLCET